MTGVGMPTDCREATAVMLLMADIGDTRTPSDFRRRFRIQIKTGILHAMRSRRIDKAIAEECWRAVTGGAR